MAKILVVEDEPGIAFSLESDLEAEGYEVTVVGDGVRAIARAAAEPFDLIVLDVMLPNKDGFEVCRELRQTGVSTPIVMLTAKSDEFDKVLGLDLGANDYVTKPFRPRELRARIRAALRHQPNGVSISADLQRQLRVASQVQQRLFPQHRPVVVTLDYAGVCQPALAMSGDYYDFLDVAPGQIGIVVADVVAKGIPAAMLMASVHASIRTHARLLGNSCGEVVAQLNRTLYEATEASKFATVFYAVYDGCSRRLTYANAGHEPPLILRSGEQFMRLDSLTPPVGLFPALPPLQNSIQLDSGDWLAIFTDGVSEALNEAGEEFGADRLQEIMSRHCDYKADHMRDAILSEWHNHSRGVPQADDVTLVVARVL